MNFYAGMSGLGTLDFVMVTVTLFVSLLLIMSHFQDNSWFFPQAYNTIFSSILRKYILQQRDLVSLLDN